MAIASCNAPGHVSRLAFLRRVTAGKPGAGKYELPHWTKDAKGRGPYLLVLQVYDWRHNLELEAELRPCKGCWRKMIYWALGIRRDKIAQEHPEFSLYLGWEPTFLRPDEEEVRVVGGRYKEIRRMVRICLEEEAKRKKPTAL